METSKGQIIQLLLIVTTNFIEIRRVKRGIKVGNLSDAHTGPIIGVYGLIPYKLTNKKYKEAPL